MFPDVLYTNEYLLPTALAGFVIALIWIFYLHRKIVRLTRGESGKSLEALIRSSLEEAARARTEVNALRETVSELKQRSRKNVSGLGVVRFNALSGEGGNRSFSVALINDEGSGAVVTGLHTRERMSVYAKPVQNFASPLELSEEEHVALKGARAQQQG